MRSKLACAAVTATFVAAVSGLAVAACSPSAPAPNEDEWIDGGVYPNKRPKLAAPAGYFGYVSDNGSDTVSVVDLPAGNLVASVPVGRDPVGIDGPHHLAVDPAGFVYVALAYPAPATSPGPHSAHSSSRRAGYVQKLAPDDLRIVGEVRVDPNPGDVVLSDDGARLVVSHFDLQKAVQASLTIEARRATLALIDPRTLGAPGAAAPKQIPVCLAPHGVALSRPAGAVAYVACYGEDALGVVDLDNPEAPVVRVPIGPNGASNGAPVYGPYSAVLSPTNALVAIGNTESKDTRFFDTASRQMIGLVVTTQGAPFFAAWSGDGTKIYIPTQTPDALIVADSANGAVLAQRRFEPSACIKPHEAVLSNDGQAMYLVCEGDHVGPGTVLVLDPQSLETRTQLGVGVYPDRITFRRAP